MIKESIGALNMDYTLEERCDLIEKSCLESADKNPITLFIKIANRDFVRIHGPEHHVLDGACILTAYKNSGGDINLKEGLDHIEKEGLRMPGGICGYWGFCGSTSSVGVALSFIEKTGPLTKDGSWGEHLLYSAEALKRLGELKGPRCCKRDAYISIITGVDFINSHYDIKIDKTIPVCGFYMKNEQCLNEQCPFNPKTVRKDIQY